MKLSIDLSREPGLELVLKDYQAEVMKHLWSVDKGQSSREVWEAINTRLLGKKTVSRASIINFLNAMTDDDFLSYTETTGKGGHRRIYSAALTEREFWTKITREVTAKLGKVLRKIEK